MKLPSTPMVEFFRRLCVRASNEAIEFPISKAISISRNSRSSSILHISRNEGRKGCENKLIFETQIVMSIHSVRERTYHPRDYAKHHCWVLTSYLISMELRSIWDWCRLPETTRWLSWDPWWPFLKRPSRTFLLRSVSLERLGRPLSIDPFV